MVTRAVWAYLHITFGGYILRRVDACRMRACDWSTDRDLTVLGGQVRSLVHGTVMMAMTHCGTGTHPGYRGYPVLSHLTSLHPPHISVSALQAVCVYREC